MKRALLVAAALAACGTAHAAGVGVKIGTTGLGIDVAKNIFPTLDARVGYSGGSIGYDASTSNASYSGDIKLSNLNALLDFHPLGPLFRISGGLVFNKNKYEATGTASGQPGSFNATVESGRSAAPYLGIGWGNVAGMGVNFYADLGVMFMGTPKASISANCSGLSGAQCTALQNQVSSEQQNLQDKLDRLKAYPVLTIGLTVGF
jgi:hypothetical protein